MASWRFATYMMKMMRALGTSKGLHFCVCSLKALTVALTVISIITSHKEGPTLIDVAFLRVSHYVLLMCVVSGTQPC